MPLQAFVDAFNIGTGAVASTVVRTGYGFQPKACIYFWSGRTESVDTVNQLDLKGGVGFACSPTDRRCISTQSDFGPTTMATDRKHNNAQCIEALTITGTVDGNADLQSFDSDGQTLVIDSQFTTNLRVHCLAIGGADLLDAATFQAQAPLAIGTADITTLGFQPSAVLLSSIGLATAPAAATGGARWSLGFATATSTQAVVASLDTDAVATSVAARYAFNAECVAMMVSNSSITFRASLTSFLSTGLRLNWLEVDGTTQPYVFGLALRGGQYAVGSLSTASDTTTPMVVSGLGFAPVGVFMASHGATQDTQDTPNNGRLSMHVGAFTSPTNRGCQATVSLGSAGTANCAALLEHAACYCNVNAGLTAAERLLDVQSMDSGGFTCIMDAAVAGATIVYYLAMGSAPIAGTILPTMLQHSA
jgi:hypothetical protein